MNDIDLLDWTSFDRAVEAGYVQAIKALEATRGEAAASRLYLA
jgi:hypothetical protein